MNKFFITAAIRLLLGAVSGYLVKAGIDSSALDTVQATLTSGASPGTIVVGVLSFVIPLVWAHFSTRATALIDKAVHVSGGAASPLASAAPQAKMVATRR